MTLPRVHAAPDRPAFGPALASIVAPIAPDAFLREHWKVKPLFVPGGPGRLTRLLADAGTLDVPALLTQSRLIQILGRENEPPPPFAAPMGLALDAHYNQGATLYFHLRKDTLLHGWARSLAFELGELGGNLSFFATRAGGESDPHFDRNENFTIQLRGAKRWLVAPNGFIEAPDRNWRIGAAPPPHASGAAPARMPAAQEYLLEPGSMLYVPRGFLHRVEAVGGEDSLSCNIMFQNILFGEVLLYILRARLFADPAMRTSVTGAFGARWGLDGALGELRQALTALERSVQEVTAAHFSQLVEDTSDLEKQRVFLRLLTEAPRS